MITFAPYAYEIRSVAAAREQYEAWLKDLAAEAATLMSEPAPVPEPTEFVKHDAGKVELGLLPFAALTEVGKAFTHGAKKYGADNYMKGASWRRYLSALLRHTFSWAMGEDADLDTGLSHLAHAGACVLILLSLVLAKRGIDDRLKLCPGE